MMELRIANIKDAKKEWEIIKDIPENENGFTNQHFDVSYDDFINDVLPTWENHRLGKNLPDGWVAASKYFLWDNNEIVGVFNFRHYLNEFLKNGPGHIGYYIIKKYRKKGYATKGLKLMIDIAKNIIPENEIYMSCNIDNPASLKVQLNNGAYIHHSNDKEHFTRIKINNVNS